MVEQTPVWLSDTCYPVAQLRRMTGAEVCTEGVGGDFPYAPEPSSVGGQRSFYTGSLAVTTAGSGMDLSVLAGEAYIQGDDDPDQGMYWVENDATVTLTVGAASASDPRIDQIIATVRDNDYAGSDDDWVLSVLPGAATAGATLANRNGAAALPNNSIRLADILVPTSFAGPFVNATHIQDRRVPFGMCGAGVPRMTIQVDGATGAYNFVKATWPWLKSVRVRAWGAGGGGGGGNGGVANASARGAGGGGGGYAEAIIDTDRLAATEVCTPGTQGSAGSNTGGNGGPGGNSTFGAWVTGTGGGGGTGMTPAITTNLSVAGGSGSLGTLSGVIGYAAEGADGQSGQVFATSVGGTQSGYGNRPNGGAAGGGGGGGGRGGEGASAAQGGGEPGGGGGGGGSSTGNAGQTGALGGGGMVVIELFG